MLHIDVFSAYRWLTFPNFTVTRSRTPRKPFVSDISCVFYSLWVDLIFLFYVVALLVLTKNLTPSLSNCDWKAFLEQCDQLCAVNGFLKFILPGSASDPAGARFFSCRCCYPCKLFRSTDPKKKTGSVLGKFSIKRISGRGIVNNVMLY